MQALDRGALGAAAFLFLNLLCEYHLRTRQGMDGGVILTCMEVPHGRDTEKYDAAVNVCGHVFTLC